MAFKLSKKIGEKYRIQTDKGGFLRQMGPRKLSKDRAEYRLALLNGEEPYDYVNDPTSPETSAANQATIDNYVASQDAAIATAQSKIEADNATIAEQNAAIEAANGVIAEQQAILDNPEATEEQKAAAQAEIETQNAAITAAQKKIASAERDITLQKKKIATAKANKADAANKAPATAITEVPEVLVLDNTPKKGYDIEADFSVNENTVIKANEKVKGGIKLNNTGEPANVTIDVGNSDITLAANSNWNEVYVKSVANDTLTVAASTHINKLIIEKGRVWVNNALISDCIDEVEIKGGKVEANPEIIASKASDFYSKPSVVKINNNLTFKSITSGIFTSGHHVIENNAKIEFTSTSSTAAGGFLYRGLDLTIDMKGDGEYRSLTNPLFWLSDAKAVVNIYGGKFFQDGNSDECIYAESGIINIYGGEFHNVKEEGKKDFLLNCFDKNYAAGTAKIVVYGGKFYGFDPAANAAESADMTTNFVAEGYKSVYNEEEGYYEVVKDE